MSKPTPGPSRTRPRWDLRALGPWTPAKALGACAGALALVSLVTPALGLGAASQGAGGGATVPAPAASALTPVTASEGSPSRAAAGTSTTTRAATANAVPTRAAGTTRVLAVPGADSAAAGRTVRYTVEVEDGAGVDEAQYAQVVRDVLTDKRGWETQDKVHFVNVSPDAARGGERPDVRITLASPDTVDRMCAPMLTEGQVSCFNGDRVALNAVRWTQGVPYYPDDLLHYRIYLVNHEVGHAIGHGHEGCPAPGRPAPVMLQQTLGLQGCTRYPWPVPGQEP